MANKPAMLSPGVRITEVDQSSYTPLMNPPSNNFILIGTAQFGPINEPVAIASQNEFISVFGNPIDDSGRTACKVLNNGGSIYYIRAFSQSEKTPASGETPAVLKTLEEHKITGNLEGGAGKFLASNAKIEVIATQPGTLMTGTFAITVSRVKDNETAFKLSVSCTNGTVTTAVVPETELSTDNTATNYYGNFVNDYFKFTFTGITFNPSGDNVKDSDTQNLNSGDNGNTTVKAIAAAIGATSIADSPINIVSDPELISGIVLACPKFSSDSTLATQLVNAANSRKDLLLVIDHEISPENAEEVITAFNSIDSSYVACYALKEGYTTDPFSDNAEVSCYVSEIILPAMAREWITAGFPLWTPPAGAVRFELSDLTRGIGWNQEERDKLYEAGINPIANYKNLGWTSVGQKTKQSNPSATDRINVRMLSNYCKRQIEHLTIPYQYSPIDDVTFSSWTLDITNFLEGIRVARGLYDFTVKMDWDTVTDDAVNNNLMPAIVKIKPTKVAEFIDIDLVLVNYSDEM